MKTMETTKTALIKEEKQSLNSLEFGDVVVYHEMADQTSVKLNLVEQVNLQFSQLEEMMAKRQFVMKEILQQLID